MKLSKLNLFRNSQYYSFQDILLVVFALLISKSLYYDLLGESLLYIPFFGLLIILSYLKGIKIQKKLLLYSLFFVILILLNPQTQYNSLILLVLRLAMGIMFLSLINFQRFSYAFIDIVTFLGLVSLLTIPIIFFDIHSSFPYFVHGDSTYRNFLLFGVLENFIEMEKYRINGLWWEPGAFQVFVNIAFLFSIINKSISKNLYLLFLVVIFLINSTTGLIVFLLLSFVYYTEINKKKNIVYIIIGIPLLFYFFIIYLIPKILEKFDTSSLLYGSFLSRYYDMVISFELWSRNIFLGYGYGAYNMFGIPLVRETLGDSLMQFSVTGADGLTSIVAQVGILMMLFLIPLLWPRYLNQFKLSSKIIVVIAYIFMFNTENFSYTFLFILLTFYGLVGNNQKLRGKTKYV